MDFKPKPRMTRWYEPLAMVRLVLRMWRTRRMPDQRDQPDGQPEAVVDYDHETGDFWFDYVADMGDAFDPTMCVAWHLGRRQLLRTDIDPRLRVDPGFAIPDIFPAAPEDDIPKVLPRGQLLIMGGDQVYPAATHARYHNQLVGPYGLAWERDPDRATEPGADLLVLPANHDWYGGLAPFRDTFCMGKKIGGWRTSQRCTWWAARLAHGWWVWGIDTALDGTVNPSQYEYFRAVKAAMPPDARLIVCIPVPAWRLRERYINNFDTLNRFLIGLAVEPEIFLSGDYHIAALHRRDKPTGVIEWHLTSGGGGAFQHPVHNLDRRIPDKYGGLPEPGLDETAPFQLLATWPSNAESREGTSGWWHLLFDRAAVSLVATLTVLQLIVMWLVGSDHRSPSDNARSVAETFVDHLVPVGAATSLALAALATFVLATASSSARGAMSWARSVGLGHGIAQAAVFATARLLGNLAVRQTEGALTAWLILGGVAVTGSVASIIVLGTYLRFANRGFRMHDNESYSAKHSGDNRNFARFRISPDGRLSCYVIAFRRTGTDWADALDVAGTQGTASGAESESENLPPPDTSDPELINVRFRSKANMSFR